MNIAILSSIAWKTPPDEYGPWEQVAADVAAGLMDLGHSVTVFATLDSPNAQGIAPHPYEQDPAVKAHADDWGLSHIVACYRRAHEFDIIHNHFNYRPLILSPLIKTPLVTTVHSGTIEFRDPYILDTFKRFNRSTSYVAISNAAQHQDLTYAATIHHGIDADRYPFNSHPKDYLLVLGRIHPDKGVADAIAVAKTVKRPLIIAGIIHDQEYFDTKVKPHLSASVRFIGPVGGRQKIDLIRHAAASLSITSFEEPFGLSVIESMMCGTPVIVSNRGAYPETVKSGVSGFIVTSIKEALAAVSQIPSLNRQKIRAYALTHFSRPVMAQKYLRLYQSILNPGIGNPGID